MASEDQKNLIALLRVIAYAVITLLIIVHIILIDWFFSSERIRNRCLEPMQGAAPAYAAMVYYICSKEYPQLFTPKD